ncbi:MAG: ATP-dependent Clp protease proteolytic subunit [uncultured Sulfurovum sp.]|uniref:ATP-dependent Clp protease proteolytic subunit n=1 Tax=uncultured Sulfurovum sp. TaxID=269237 RepID=A0A6S6TXV4_9BACT|nr:MAG: ATP-dependent Clp protease proteolytic subunit [uncultured Sulfurovum sp.]
MTGAKKELSSEQHTLYSEMIPEHKRLINKEKNLFEVTPKHKSYRVYIGRFFELKKGLHSVFNELREAKEHDVLEFMIDSGGGFVNEGMQFYNIMQEKFNGRTVAYLDNKGYSMGAMLFSMADKRVAYPYSDFMYHNYAGGAVGKGGEIKARLEHTSKKLEKFFHDVIVQQGFLSEEEYQQMLVGQDYWMGTKELCQRGIATHVICQGQELTAKEYLKHLKKEKKIKKELKKEAQKAVKTTKKKTK